MISKSYAEDGLKIEAQRGLNGLAYIAWKPHSSGWFSSRSALLQYVQSPSLELLDWLDETDPLNMDSVPTV